MANQWEEWRTGGRGLGGRHLGAWVSHTGVGLGWGGAGGAVAALVSHSRAGNTGRTVVEPQGCMHGRTMSERKGEASLPSMQPNMKHGHQASLTPGWSSPAKSVSGY